MPIQLADLLNDQRTVTVHFAGDTIDVVYRPGAITPDLGARVGQDKEKPLALLLSELILRWDLFDSRTPDEFGNPTRIPTDYDTVAKLPSKFLRTVQRVIMDDSYGSEDSKKNSGAASGDGSQPGAAPARVRSFTR